MSEDRDHHVCPCFHNFLMKSNARSHIDVKNHRVDAARDSQPASQPARTSPPRQAMQGAREYKVLLLLALLFYKASKRSEPATTYAHALNPRFRRPTAQGCQSLSGGAWLCRDILLDYRKPALRCVTSVWRWGGGVREGSTSHHHPCPTLTDCVIL